MTVLNVSAGELHVYGAQLARVDTINVTGGAVHLHEESGPDLAALSAQVAKVDFDIRGDLKERFDHMSQELDDLTAAVTAEDTVIGGAITLINGFVGQLAGLQAKLDAAIAANAAGQAATQELADLKAALTSVTADVTDHSQQLAGAVASVPTA